MLSEHVKSNLMVRDFVLALDRCLQSGYKAPGVSQSYDDARDTCHHLWAMMDGAQRTAADKAFSRLVTEQEKKTHA